MTWYRGRRRLSARELEAKLAEANRELAKLGDEHHFLHQRFARERDRAEELTAQLRQCNARRVEAQAQAAAADTAGQELGDKLQQAEERAAALAAAVDGRERQLAAAQDLAARARRILRGSGQATDLIAGALRVLEGGNDD